MGDQLSYLPFKMVFNINRYFQLLGILYGPFDGLHIQMRPVQRIYSFLLRFVMTVFVMKQFAAARFANELMISFFLANLTYSQGYALSFVHMMVISSYFAWALFSMHFFCKINQNPLMRYWMLLLPHTHSNDRRSIYWEKRKRLCVDDQVYKKLEQQFFFWSPSACYIILLGSLLVVQLAALYYLITLSFLTNQLPVWLFWSVGLGNMLSLSIMGTHAFVVTIAVSFYFIYLTYLFQLKLTSLCRAFHDTRIKKSNLYSNFHARLNQHLSYTTIILMDLIKVNAFWCRVIGVNYFGCQGAITLLLVLVFISTSSMIKASFLCLVFGLHTLCLTMPLWMAGRVSWLVSFKFTK